MSYLLQNLSVWEGNATTSQNMQNEEWEDTKWRGKRRQYEDNYLSHCESDSDSHSDTFTPYDQALPNLENAPNANEQADNPVIPDLVEEQPPLNPPQDQLQQHDRRRRQRRPPAWHADYEMGEE